MTMDDLLFLGENMDAVKLNVQLHICTVITEMMMKDSVH